MAEEVKKSSDPCLQCWLDRSDWPLEAAQAMFLTSAWHKRVHVQWRPLAPAKEKSQRSRLSHPSPASDGAGGSWALWAWGTPRETAAHPVSPDRWCRLHWGCCAGRWLGQAGYKAQTLPQQAAGPCGQSEACRPALALTAPPPRASPSPTIVVCHTSHAITAMIKATATSHRGHCGDHQFLIGLRLGLHLCYSMRTFQSFSALNQLQTPQWGLWGSWTSRCFLLHPGHTGARAGGLRRWAQVLERGTTSSLAHPSHLPQQCLLGL